MHKYKEINAKYKQNKHLKHKYIKQYTLKFLQFITKYIWFTYNLIFTYMHTTYKS